jgi:hypothetical protein
MKVKKISFIISLFILTISPLKALGGIGVYGVSDKFVFPPTSDARFDGPATEYWLHTESFENAAGAGLFVYVDALPYIDIEGCAEIAGNIYPFSTTISLLNMESSHFESEGIWGRTSLFLTVRKDIFKIKIPILAKVKFYLGGGLNTHAVIPMVTWEMVEAAFIDEDNPYILDFSDEATKERLIEYVIENRIETSGFHIQTGLQLKLLFLNAFVNARYTFAKDVIPNENGFPSVWTGLSIGF